jgi:hypothetical protein
MTAVILGFMTTVSLVFWRLFPWSLDDCNPWSHDVCYLGFMTTVPLVSSVCLLCVRCMRRLGECANICPCGECAKREWRGGGIANKLPARARSCKMHHTHIPTQYTVFLPLQGGRRPKAHTYNIEREPSCKACVRTVILKDRRLEPSSLPN